MRTISTLDSAPRKVLTGLAALVLAILLALAVRAQVEGERGIAPIAASSDIQVSGIEVDTRGDTSNEARQNGWAEATRKAWERLEGPSISDGQLESLVSSIVIEREQLGPKRYIARLGVIFDRARAQRYLGGEAQAAQSVPMLLVPVTMSAGSQLVYETRNPWQRAWAEFQPGTSRINYVRPSGAGGESLLVNYGQTERRSRIWWRNILDQFEAGGVLVAIARLDYSYPGGPVSAQFTARYGPDSRYLDGFAMTAETPAELPAMLDRAVERFDRIYEQALADGKLRPDPTLNLGSVDADPALRRLIEIGRAAQARERAEAQSETPSEEGEATPTPTPTAAAVTTYVVQFATPDAATVDAVLGSVRGAAGVRGASTSSIAIGGTSVMRVSFAGSLDQLAAALRARGFGVQQGSNALLISR